MVTTSIEYQINQHDEHDDITNCTHENTEAAALETYGAWLQTIGHGEVASISLEKITTRSTLGRLPELDFEVILDSAGDPENK